MILSIKAGAAHVAFSAPSRTAVREFYTKALQAGGRPHGSPSTRNDGFEIFNAAVLDMDGNSIEVVYHQDGLDDDFGSFTGKSRVLTWNKDVSASLGDNKSVVSLNSFASTAKNLKALVPANSSAARSKASSTAHSAVSKSSSRTKSEPFAVQRSFTAPVMAAPKSNDNIEISRKTLVGTILGAAAGAAVAYAMCKSEEDSAKAEEAAYYAVQNSSRQLQASHPRLLEGPPSYTSRPRSVRNASEVGSYYEDGYPMRAIEAPPPSGYHHPSYTTVAPSQHPEHISSSGRSRVSLTRSNTMPERRPQSTLISSFAPTESPREPREGSHHTPRSHHSKAKASSHSKSRRSSSRTHSRLHSPAPPMDRIPEAIAAPPARGSSVLGRNYEAEPYVPPEGDRSNHDDADTVAPSDSISNAGDSTRRRRRSRAPSSTPSHSRDASRRNSESGGSEHGKHHAAAGGHSKQRKHRSKRSGSGSRDEVQVVRPDGISEVGSESTLTPAKYRQAGSAMSLPIRGITPSTLQGGGRSIVSYYG
jgi:hypothetical protein